MRQAEAAQSEDPQGLATVAWTVVVDVPYAPAYFQPRYLRTVREDAERLFVGPVDILRSTPTPGLERFTITGQLPATNNPEGQRRRLQSHYAEGFGRRATIAVEGSW